MGKNEAVWGDVKPVAPYSPAIKRDNMLFLSGQIGLKDGALVAGGVKEQTHQALVNMFALVRKAGLEPRDIVKVTVLMTTMEHYGDINEVYKTAGEVAGIDVPPAREAYAVVGLPLGALVEISAIAVKQD